MVFGVSAWSYHATDLDLFQMAEEAKKVGFDAFEVLDLPCEESEALDYAARFREHCDKLGITILSAAISADFLNGCDGDFEREVARLCRKVDVAEALGAKLMRHDAAWRAPDKNPELTFDDVLPTLAAGCRAVTEYAAEKGIRTMTENHGRFAQGSERMIRLVKAVDHPNYGILIDMGNVTGIDEHPLSAVKAMLPYAFHVHCKDFFILPGTADPGAGYNLTEHGNYTRPTIVGHGNVDVKACIKAVKESGYQGAMMLEFEGMEEPLEAVRIGHDNMRRYWEEA